MLRGGTTCRVLKTAGEGVVAAAVRASKWALSRSKRRVVSARSRAS